MPKLECKIESHEKQFDVLTRQRREINTSIVSKAVDFERYEDTIVFRTISELEERHIQSAGYIGKASGIFKQEWYLEKKKIEIYRHLQDGVAAFTTMDSISVFYLCRDSSGEGGSGQMWFQESIFKYILEKLLDGGLIVTDGSGYDFTISETAEWKSLWVNRRANSEEEVVNPSDFVYYNRKFTCLGSCGQGYGPIYLWRVTKK